LDLVGARGSAVEELRERGGGGLPVQAYQRADKPAEPVRGMDHAMQVRGFGDAAGDQQLLQSLIDGIGVVLVRDVLTPLGRVPVSLLVVGEMVVAQSVQRELQGHSDGTRRHQEAVLDGLFEAVIVSG
jgi:hypothetical protein